MTIRHLTMMLGLTLMLATGCSSSPMFVDAISVPEGEDGSRLIVLPVTGVAPGVGRPLAENMAWGLREAGYPAHFAAAADGANPYVMGTVEEIDVGGAIVWLSLRWMVYDADERVTGVHRHQVAVSLDDWAQLSKQTLMLIVTEAVPAVHELAAQHVFPDGFAAAPRKPASVSASEHQLAALDAAGDVTVVISGEGMATVDADEPFDLAQFDPVFEPATAGPREPEPANAAGETPEPEAAVAPLETAEAAGETMDVIDMSFLDGLSGQLTEQTADDAALAIAGPTPGSTATAAVEAETTPLEIVEQAVVSPSSGLPDESSTPSVSPFADIADGAGGFGEYGQLTPETAALVTTDPWLTIPEPMVPPTAKEKMLIAAAPSTPPPEFESESVSEAEFEPASEAAPGAIAVTPAGPPPIAPVAEIAQLAAVAPAADRQAATPALQPEAEQSVEVAAGAVSAGQLGVETPRAAGRPVFLVRRVHGAPGDGNAALTQAIRLALRGIDAAVTDDPAHATHVLQGSVRVDAPFAGRQKARVVWQVTGIDGFVTGQAVQENQVPQGSLDGSWGSTADAVASAAVNGIAKLFDGPLAGGGADGLSQPDLPHVGND